MGKRTHDVLPMVVISPGVDIVSKDLAEKCIQDIGTIATIRILGLLETTTLK